MNSGELNLAGFVLTLLAIALAVVGSLMLSKAYHPYSTFWGFFSFLGSLVRVLIQSGWSAARNFLEDSFVIGSLNKPNIDLLIGSLLVLFGFIFQVVATFCLYWATISAPKI